MVRTSPYLDVSHVPGHSIAFKSTKFGTKWVVIHSLYDCVCACPLIFFDWWAVFILFSIFKLGCLVVNVAITISMFARWLAENLHRQISFLLNLYWHCPILCYAPGGALGVYLNQPILRPKEILFKATSTEVVTSSSKQISPGPAQELNTSYSSKLALAG